MSTYSTNSLELPFLAERKDEEELFRRNAMACVEFRRSGTVPTEATQNSLHRECQSSGATVNRF